MPERSNVSVYSPLVSVVMSSIIIGVIIAVICGRRLRVLEQARCCLGALLLLVLPDVIHLLHLQHFYYEDDDELVGGMKTYRPNHILSRATCKMQLKKKKINYLK